MDDLHVSVRAETLFELGPLNVTNSLATMVVLMALMVLGIGLIARRASVDKPGRAQSIIEMVVEFLLDLVENTAGKRVGRRVFPLVAGLFIFIILANYSGLLPGVGTVGFYEDEGDVAGEHAQVASIQYATEGEVEDGGHHKTLIPFMRSPNADLNMTLAMALITFTVVQVAGVAAHGVGGRLKHLADPPFMFPIEVIGELSRVISLSFRLFGNIFAGEVLVTVMVTMSAAVLEKTVWIAVPFFALPTIFLFLEVLFGFIQALVFALLTLIYISLAAAGHDDHGDEHDHAHGHAPAHGHGAVPAAAGGD